MRQTDKNHKIIPPRDLPSLVKTLRREQKSIATLNGSFDLLHAGHLYILEEASKRADCLIVALNSDASIASYKGKERPIISLRHRQEMIAALSVVDFVTHFEESTPLAFLRLVAPDVHVNGAEYGHSCVEAPLLKELGASLVLAKRIQELSTSQIISKIQKLSSPSL